MIERAHQRSARFLRIADSVGTIERGKMADLVLLEANPFQGILNTRRIAAVMLRGTLYDRGGLEHILAAVRRRRIDRFSEDFCLAEVNCRFGPIDFLRRIFAAEPGHRRKVMPKAIDGSIEINVS